MNIAYLSLVSKSKYRMELVRSWIGAFRKWLLSLIAQSELSIAVVGLQNSGKTTFTELLTGGAFEEDTIPTLGVNIREVLLSTNTLVRIYDLAGQSRFQYLWDRCFQKVDLIIYLLDLSDMTNWKQAKTKLHDVTIATNIESVPMLILGNKTDLLSNVEDPKTFPEHNDGKENTSTNKMTWNHFSPILLNYEFDDIPKYEFNSSNQHLLAKVEILSKELGIDLKQGLLHLPHNSKVKLNRDIGLFCVSCKDGSYINDILEWITQL